METEYNALPFFPSATSSHPLLKRNGGAVRGPLDKDRFTARDGNRNNLLQALVGKHRRYSVAIGLAEAGNTACHERVVYIRNPSCALIPKLTLFPQIRVTRISIGPSVKNRPMGVAGAGIRGAGWQ